MGIFFFPPLCLSHCKETSRRFPVSLGWRAHCSQLIVLGVVFVFFPLTQAGRCILYGDPPGWGRNPLYCGAHSEGHGGRAVHGLSAAPGTHAQSRIHPGGMQEWIWLGLGNRAQNAQGDRTCQEIHGYRHFLNVLRSSRCAQVRALGFSFSC